MSFAKLDEFRTLTETISFAKRNEKRLVVQTITDRHPHLSELVQSLQARGIYSFSKDLARRTLNVSDSAVGAAIKRLRAKGILVSPRRGFYVIVPAEYRTAGAPPPAWFVEQLMRYHDRPYYVALLSAAELHGAAHHRPQEFQVVTDTPLRPIVVGRTKMCFFVKRHIDETQTSQVKTHTGYIRVSTPEATAFDLVRYVDSVGFLDNVATVFSELQEKIDAQRLTVAAKKSVALTVIQRCGYLLDLVGAQSKTGRLAKWVTEQHPRPTPLRPDRPSRDRPLDPRWQVVVNEDVEPDA